MILVFLPAQWQLLPFLFAELLFYLTSTSCRTPGLSFWLFTILCLNFLYDLISALNAIYMLMTPKFKSPSSTSPRALGSHNQLPTLLLGCLAGISNRACPKFTSCSQTGSASRLPQFNKQRDDLFSDLSQKSRNHSGAVSFSHNFHPIFQ